MEFKHLVFFVLVFLGIPSAILILRTNIRLQKITIFLMIFTIPFVYSTGINFFTDEFYRGTSRGYEILASDMIALTLSGFLITRWGWRNYKFTAPGSYFYFLYFILSCISTVNSESLLYSGYELMKMTTMYIYFITLYNCILRYKDLKVILYAFSVIIIFTFFYMLVQKYAMSVYQPAGIFPHRNSAAMFANMVAPIFLSLMFNTSLSKRMFWFFSVVYALTAIVVVIALSRGSILFFPIAAGLVTAVSFTKGVNSKKTKILLTLAIIAILGSIKASNMVIERFENAPQASTDGRVQLAKAAINMANDKFFGVGVNNWGIKINPPYTYTQGTGMERPSDDYKSGLVETIYMLVAAECGWIGLLSLLMWFGYYYIQNALNILRYKNLPAVYMAIGLFGGMSAVFGQSILEWILKQPTNFFQLMIVFAIIAAMTDIYRKKLSPKRK